MIVVQHVRAFVDPFEFTSACTTHQDRHEEAEHFFSLAQAIREKMLESDDPYLAFTLDGRALAIQNLVRARGRYE